MPIDTPISPATGAPIADRAETVPPATPPPLPLLTQDDLDDPERFVTIPGVPILDAHNDDPENGVVDLPELILNARNTNHLIATRGKFPALAIGHLPKTQTPTREISKGDVTIRVLGTDHTPNPKIVGYTSRYRVGRFQDRPCLFCDHHIHNHLYKDASNYPFRSVERIRPDPDFDGPDDPSRHFIDRVSLVDAIPRRDLGALHYQAFEPGLVRSFYTRDFPPMMMKMKEREHEADAGMPPGADSGVPPPTETPPTEPQAPSEDLSTSNSPSTPLPGEDSMSVPDATASPAESPVNDMAELVASVRELVGTLKQLMPAPDEGETNPDEAGADTDTSQYDTPLPDETETGVPDNVAQYGGEAGGTATAVPAACPGKPKMAGVRREEYARDLKTIDRSIGTLDQNFQDMFQRILDLENERDEGRLANRRLHYAQDLRTSRDELGINLDDAAIEELVGKLALDTPVGFEAEKIHEVRTRYATSPVGRHARLEIGAPAAPPRKGAQVSEAHMMKARAYAYEHGGTYTAALAEVMK